MACREVSTSQTHCILADVGRVDAHGEHREAAARGSSGWRSKHWPMVCPLRSPPLQVPNARDNYDAAGGGSPTTSGEAAERHFAYGTSPRTAHLPASAPCQVLALLQPPLLQLSRSSASVVGVRRVGGEVVQLVRVGLDVVQLLRRAVAVALDRPSRRVGRSRPASPTSPSSQPVPPPASLMWVLNGVVGLRFRMYLYLAVRTHRIGERFISPSPVWAANIASRCWSDLPAQHRAGSSGRRAPSAASRRRRSSIVGSRSTRLTIAAVVLRRLHLPGQRTSSGTRMPASYSVPLRERPLRALVGGEHQQRVRRRSRASSSDAMHLADLPVHLRHVGVVLRAASCRVSRRVQQVRRQLDLRRVVPRRSPASTRAASASTRPGTAAAAPCRAPRAACRPPPCPGPSTARASSPAA